MNFKTISATGLTLLFTLISHEGFASKGLASSKHATKDSGPKAICKEKAKEVAKVTYTTCLAEDHQNEVERIKAEYQTKLDELKSKYEKKIQILAQKSQRAGLEKSDRESEKSAKAISAKNARSLPSKKELKEISSEPLTLDSPRVTLKPKPGKRSEKLVEKEDRSDRLNINEIETETPALENQNSLQNSEAAEDGLGSITNRRGLRTSGSESSSHQLEDLIRRAPKDSSKDTAIESKGISSELNLPPSSDEFMPQ